MKQTRKVLDDCDEICLFDVLHLGLHHLSSFQPFGFFARYHWFDWLIGYPRSSGIFAAAKSSEIVVLCSILVRQKIVISWWFAVVIVGAAFSPLFGSNANSEWPVFSQFILLGSLFGLLLRMSSVRVRKRVTLNFK